MTTTFISYSLADENENEDGFTSLGGGDDDNNNNNSQEINNPETGKWQTLAWFVIGSLLTIPMTECCLDPILLIWGMKNLWMAITFY